MTSEHIYYDKSHLAEPAVALAKVELQENLFVSKARQLFLDLQTNFPPWFATFKETLAQGNKPLIKRYGPGLFLAKERILIRGNFLTLVASLEPEVAVPALVSAITTVGSTRRVYTPEEILHSLSYRFNRYYSSADRWQIVRRPLKEQERVVLASVYYLLAEKLALEDERLMPFARYYGGLKIKTPAGYIPIAEYYSSRYERTSISMPKIVDEPLPFSSLSEVIDPDDRLFQEFSSAVTNAPEISFNKKASLKRLFMQEAVSLFDKRDLFEKFISLVKAGKKPEEVVAIMEMFIDFLKGANNNRVFSPTLHRFLGC